MVRVLHTCGVIVLILAGVVCYLTARYWSGHDPRMERILQCPSAIEQSMERRVQSDDAATQDGPLVIQAEAFSLYLQPPLSEEKVVELPAPSAEERENHDPIPLVRPQTPVAKFVLRATSYCPQHPRKSVALIWEPGSLDSMGTWVREGSQVGHFTIYEIRQGAITYRDGDDLREMSIMRGASMPSIVRHTRPASLKVSAAVDGIGIALPTSAGPNNVTLTGD